MTAKPGLINMCFYFIITFIIIYSACVRILHAFLLKLGQTILVKNTNNSGISLVEIGVCLQLKQTFELSEKKIT